MIPLTVTLDLEQTPWTDLSHREQANGPNQVVNLERIGLLRNGTIEGRATVELLATLPNDGRLLVVTTSLRNFRFAAAAILASPIAQAEADR